MTPFRTIQYCSDNSIPCFNFDLKLNKGDKQYHNCPTAWQKLTKPLLKDGKNGFAILTGITFWVLDIDDIFQDLPQNIQKLLMNDCKTVVKTRRGYHFYFKLCNQSQILPNRAKVFFIDKDREGIDIRNKGGCIVAPPTAYFDEDVNVYKYEWSKGDLSTIEEASQDILNLLIPNTSKLTNDTATITKHSVLSKTGIKKEDEIKIVLDGLSVSRADNYSDWVVVGMILKNEGCECDMWDEWSQASSKYRSGECSKKWRSFTPKDKGVTLATLYHWLKLDNYQQFIQLRSTNNQVVDKLLSATNSGVAEAFYLMNPDKYMVFDSESYYLGNNNIWCKVKSSKMCDMPRIRMALQKDCLEVLESVEKNECLVVNDSDSVFESASQVSKFQSSERMKMIQRIKQKLQSTSFLNSTIELLRDHYYQDAELLKRFNGNTKLFAFNNTVFDSDLMSFRNIQPDDYISVTCGYDYREATQEEKNMVLELLIKIWPSKEVCRYMLQAISQSFLGYNYDEIFHVLSGKGSNGKSTLIDLCIQSFGEYSFCLPYTYLTKDTDSAAPVLPALVNSRHSRFVYVNEPKEDDVFQINCLKRYTGGDTCSARTLYGEEVKFKPQYKIWICTNSIPELSSFDGGIERRMRIVPFNSRFCDNPVLENEYLVNRTLKTEIQDSDSWKYGFLGLIIEEFMELNKRSLVMPKEAVKMTEDYMMKMNPIGTWLKKYYEITNSREDVVPRIDLYGTFLEDTNVHMSHKKFSDILENKCNISDKTVRGKHYYYGLKRKENIDTDDTSDVEN